VHYPGSPCPVDRSETGRRSYIDLDLATGAVQRVGIRSGLLYLRHRIPVIPGPGEIRHVRSFVLAMAEGIQLSDSEMETVRVSLEVTGFAQSRAEVAEALRAALVERFGRKEYEIDTSGLLAADDPSRAALAAEAYRRLTGMKGEGSWPSEPEAPDVEQAAEQALKLAYGAK
jgi:hypothetical protein